MKSFETIIQYSFPTQIFFGAGSRKSITENLREAALLKPLLVGDLGIAQLPFFLEIKEHLEKVKFQTTVFSEIEGNPVESQVQAGVEAYKNGTCDSIIAVGGGSVLDVAKAIALMVEHPGHLFDYEDGKPDALPIQGKAISHLLALPTTAGTGSEVGRSTVISDNTTKAKKIIFSPALLPKAVFSDPELTLGLPPSITAATGLDALTHCIEAYLAKGFHPICDGIALEGMRLIAKSLKKCVSFHSKEANGKADRDTQIYYRGLMLNAAMMGAIAFQKGLGVNHSCAHSLSTVYDLHHGLANGIMLPYTMNFNAEKESEKFMIMSQTVGIKNAAQPSDFIQWLIELKQALGIPIKLSHLGMDFQKRDELVEFAIQDICHSLNPRPVSKENFEEIFAAAI